MNKTQTIPWKQFSQKHKQYIKNALPHRMCVAEGAIRSGKTIDHCIVAAMYLEECPDKIHLASGSTMPNAKLNIGACNGFGLENLFRGRCHWGKYKDNDALFVQTKTGEKIVIFAGGGKANSYQKILGNSYGLWIATEINEHYDSEDSRESFIKVAFGRQAAAQWPFVLWDLNPCHPHHRIYSDYIDKYKTDFVGGYQYQHFLMSDNMSISEQRKKEIASQYDQDSVWYRRDILGQRCIAEGLIYSTFANSPEKYKTDKPDYDAIRIGFDFGGNKSYFAIVACGIKYDCSKLTALASRRYPAAGVDPEQMYVLIEKFIVFVQEKYGKIERMRPDSAEQTLINGIKSRFGINSKYGISIRNSVKNEIINRIKAFLGIVAQGRFYYTADCESLTAALCTAVYDPKKFEDTRLDDGTSDIDTLDAFEYSWEEDIRKYSKYYKAGEGANEYI